MIRALGPGDEPAIERFLAARSETSMFLRSNLRAGGIVDRGQTYQGAWVGAFDGEALVGVACHGWNGFVLLQTGLDRLPALVDAALAASGRAVAGISGAWEQVVAVRAHLGMVERRAGLDGPEDLFALELAELAVPEPVRAGQIRVRRAAPADEAALVP